VLQQLVIRVSNWKLTNSPGPGLAQVPGTAAVCIDGKQLEVAMRFMAVAASLDS
jgi:hypothetical protein